MTPRDPTAILDTHEVTNQPPPIGDVNLYDTDPVLKDALHREGAAWAQDRVHEFGAVAGSERVMDLGDAANRNPPELKTFDRFGQRIDEVEFHPAYHELMALARDHEVHALPWTAGRSGGYVAHTALEYLLVQAEAGVCCPTTMTLAAIPALRAQPDIAAQWEPRLLARAYDPRSIPAAEKTGVTMGMAMTEKQGGSDVRANTTSARPVANGGSGAEYLLTGHKWFCSAPMSDAFLALARTEAGLSCYLVPRWCPDWSRNRFLIQRLKDKLGDRANASAEVEFNDTWAQMVGPEGDGVRTIIEMVHHTRLDTALAGAGLMRQAVVQAVHHAAHRSAFQRMLIDQPLMQNVLADLVLEWMAATLMAMRTARAYDEAAAGDDSARHFARIAVSVAKYWINKRVTNHAYEAMECLGGVGYVEESGMPRLFRQAPVNSIWEGSGNVICLEVLRAAEREPGTMAAFLAEVEQARGADARLDAAIARLKDAVSDTAGAETRARRIVEAMAVAWQASLLTRFAARPAADAFLGARLSEQPLWTYGTLDAGTDFAAIVDQARVS